MIGYLKKEMQGKREKKDGDNSRRMISNEKLFIPHRSGFVFKSCHVFSFGFLILNKKTNFRHGCIFERTIEWLLSVTNNFGVGDLKKKWGNVLHGKK